MTDLPDKPARRRWPWPAILVSLVVLYPLSIGPVTVGALWIVYWTRIDLDWAGNALFALYFPMYWAAEHSQIVRNFWDVYSNIVEPIVPPI